MNFHLSQPIPLPPRPLTERAFTGAGDAWRTAARAPLTLWRDHKARSREARAFKVDKIVRVIAFVFAATVTAAVFGVLSAWAMSQFDPAQQQIISLAHAPRMAAGNDQEVVRLEPITVVGHRTPADQPSTPMATRQ